MSVAFLDALHADPWSEGELIDLRGLNAGAADAIAERIKETRDAARTEPRALRSTSLVVIGPPGVGKTHIFSRLRRTLGPKAVFVHVRPLVHAPMTPRFVLGEVVKQLGYATGGLVQLDALVGSLLAYLEGAAASFPSMFLDEYRQLPDSERTARLDDALEKVLAIWQDVDESYLRRLVEAPFMSKANQRAVLAWLSGRDCDLAQLSRIGATASLSEELALPALKTLCSVAALGAPIVVVLDQLENLIEGAEPGSRLLGYANLSAELVDSIRGLVLVHMALDTEWARAIEPSFNLSQRSRIVMARETLSLPTSREAEDLLRLWIERLPERPAPYPWPFTEARLSRTISGPGTTPRMLLVECRRALDGVGNEDEPGSDVEASPAPAESERGFADDWERCLNSARQVVDEANEQRACVDAGRLADGILSCTHFLEGLRISPGLAGQPAQLVLEQSEGRRLVSILNHGHHRSLGAVLTKLTTMAPRMPVIALRERARELPPTWKDTLARRDALLETGRAAWIWVEPDDVVRLLALDAMLQSARSGEVTNDRGQPVDVESVLEWARGFLDVPAWGVVKTLLGTDMEDALEASRESAPLRDGHAASEGGRARGRVARTLLEQLRVASVDRIVREAARVDPASTRTSVLEELEEDPGVKFLGRNIVCIRGYR